MTTLKKYQTKVFFLIRKAALTRSGSAAMFLQAWRFYNLQSYLANTIVIQSDKKSVSSQGLNWLIDQLTQVFCLKEVSACTTNGLVVKTLDSLSRGPVFKATGWLQGQLSLSSFRGR